MKLKTKFILGFLVLSLFIAVVGRLHIHLGGQAIDNYDALVDEVVPTVISLGELKAALLKMQREIFSNILIENESEVFQLANERQKKWQNQYFMTSKKPEDKQIVYEVSQIETAVYQLGLDLIQEKKKGSQTGLRRVKESLERTAERLNQVIDRAIAQRTEELGRGYASADLAARRSLWIANTIFIAMVFFAVAIGFLLARSIVRPIGKLREAAEKLGRGDLKSRVQVESGDEIGSLADTFNRMAQNLDESSRRLRLARDEAERANRLKSEFMRNTSHELRTPMAIIIGMNDLILDSGLNQEQQECAEAVKNASENLSRLINDLLDFSKSSTGQLTLKESPFDLHQVCDKVVSAHLARAKDKGLALTLDFPDSVPRQVLGDPGRTVQMLTVLIENAIKFTDNGSVTLKVRADAEAVGKSRFHLTVEDTGIGISPENLAHLFEDLTQLDGSTTRRYGGLGLGLSICSQLVQLMQGKIWAESVPGKGSAFHVDVSLALAAPHGESSAAPVEKRSLLISALILDPQEADQRLEKRMLEELGCSVDVAHSEEDAFQMLKEVPYDLFVFSAEGESSDHSRQVVDACRMWSVYRDVRVVGLMNTKDDDALEKCRRAGLHSVLKKPVTYRDFQQVLDQLKAA